MKAYFQSIISFRFLNLFVLPPDYRGWLDVPRAATLGMVSVLFDTNILIDYLNGVKQARTELERYSDKAISLIIVGDCMSNPY